MTLAEIKILQDALAQISASVASNARILNTLADAVYAMEMNGASPDSQGAPKPVALTAETLEQIEDRTLKIQLAHERMLDELRELDVDAWDCETCEGSGRVYQEHQAGCNVGGHYDCPDCDGKGYFIKRLSPVTPSDGAQAAGQRHNCDEHRPRPWAPREICKSPAAGQEDAS